MNQSSLEVECLYIISGIGYYIFRKVISTMFIYVVLVVAI